MSASKSEVRAQSGTNSGNGNNNPTNADALEFEFSSPLKIAEKAVAEWLGQITEAKNREDLTNINGMAHTNLKKAELNARIKFVQSAIESATNISRLCQAVILADACGDYPDYARTFQLTGCDLVSDDLKPAEINAIVLQIAAVYHELANRMPARPEIGPEVQAFGVKMASAIRQFPDGYAVCLEYPHLRVVADSGKIDLVQGSTNTVESQTAAGEISAPKVLNAYGFLAQEIRTVGRMVIVAFEMIGNRQISARSVLEMVRSEKAVIVGMSRPMCDAFEKLRVAVHEDFVTASLRIDRGIQEAYIVGTDTEGMPGA